MGNGFSSNKISLLDRGIIWANAHIRGGMECGMNWWKKGKMLYKKWLYKNWNKMNRWIMYFTKLIFIVRSNYIKISQAY